MPEYQSSQALTELRADVPALVAEMKRRAGVGTDRDLAAFLGVAQSTVSHWRQRGQVPESAVLRFEKAVSAKAELDPSRAIAARMVALRVADRWLSALGEGATPASRELVYGTVAMTFHSITDEVFKTLERYESETGLMPWPLATRMLDDDAFLQQIVDWVSRIDVSQAVLREAMSPPSVKLDRAEFPNLVSQSGAPDKKPR